MQSSNTVMKVVKFQYEVQASMGKEWQPYQTLQLFFNIAFNRFCKNTAEHLATTRSKRKYHSIELKYKEFSNLPLTSEHLSLHSIA